MSEPSATILNVNDHEPTLYYISRLLQGAGYEVVEARSGDEALRRALEGDIDLVILDVKLPDMSGFEVCRLLKTTRDTSSPMVLHVSATFTSIDRRVEGLEGGADGYLTSPFEAAELVATVRSLLRLRRTEQLLRDKAHQLRLAAEQKDEFLAMLGHELRNPLSAITGGLELLREYDSDPRQRKRVRATIERQALNLARLVEDLLDIARYTRGRIRVQRELIDLGAVIRDALTTVHSAFEHRDQPLRYEPPAEPLWVEGDGARLQQVFANLLDNASKYSPEGIPIQLRVQAEGDRVRVEIEDQGRGIAGEFLPHVFDLFAQETSSLDRTQAGLGIGLTLVRRIVELHHGEIEAHSEGLGRGSTFVVQLPLSERMGKVEPGAVDPGSKAPVSILLVEDNAEAGEMLQELLRVRGHEVDLAADGNAGLEQFTAGHYRVGLFDIGLPGMDGYQLARAIRALPHGHDVLLIALSGYGQPSDVRRALDSGFDHHFVKPVRTSELTAFIDEHLHPGPDAPQPERPPLASPPDEPKVAT